MARPKVKIDLAELEKLGGWDVVQLTSILPGEARALGSALQGTEIRLLEAHFPVRVVTNRGGRTCHAAIIARELGVPAVVGCGTATNVLEDGASVTVAGLHVVHQNPIRHRDRLDLVRFVWNDNLFHHRLCHQLNKARRQRRCN